jgi:hypothetical protein
MIYKMSFPSFLDLVTVLGWSPKTRLEGDHPPDFNLMLVIRITEGDPQK